MPDIRKLGSSESPRTDPLSYPGAAVSTSSLVTGGWFYRVVARAGADVDEWLVVPDGGPLRLASGNTMGEVLAKAGASPMAGRRPVLAVGSNAAPSQLRAKFSSSGVSDIVPITRVEVEGLRVGHSAHISASGYIPYAPFACEDPGSAALAITWLDTAQVQLIDKTEPNYAPCAISSLPAALESGRLVTDYVLYRSKWGLLRRPSDGTLVRSTTQHDVLRLLAGCPGVLDALPELSHSPTRAIHALRSSPETRERVREHLKAAGMVACDGLDRFCTEAGPRTNQR